MSISLALVLILSSQAPPGYLSVQSDRAGLRVYLDGEEIGTTPLTRHSVEPGEHWVSLFSSDSIDRHYETFRQGRLGARLGVVWYLAKVDKGSTRVTIASGETQHVFLSMSRAQRASCEAKWLAGACLAGPFVLGTLLGILVSSLAQGHH